MKSTANRPARHNPAAHPRLLDAQNGSPKPRHTLAFERLAQAARGHWGVESMHWLLDVEFGDDLSRYRSGHGAKNMATVRRFALGLIRANKT